MEFKFGKGKTPGDLVARIGKQQDIQRSERLSYLGSTS